MDYKAFVSSTFIDLKKHRARVIGQLRKAGFFVDPMEDWTAAADEPKDLSRQRLEDCHLCILLIARRRGHVPSGESLSITQLEYEEAKRRGIDVIPYVLDEDVADTDWPAWEEREEVEKWRADVLALKHSGETFHKTSETLDITPALTRWLQDQGPKTALRLYLENVKQEHGVIRFVSLPRLEDNTDAAIDRLYVEPAVADRAVSADDDPRNWPRTTPVLDALARHESLVVLGDPGSGKSTLTSWIAWQLAEYHRDGSSEWTDRLGHIVPLPMILRDLDIGKGITWEALLEKFVHTSLGRLLTLTNLKQMMADGKAMIILDGLDEIGNPQVRRDLRDAVWKAMSYFVDCRWLLTSRIVGYSEVEFDRHETRAEYRGQLGLGLRRRVAEPVKAARRYVVPFDNSRVDSFAANWFVLREQTEHKSQQQAVELLEAIRSDEATVKLGRIPNLLTMMALIYRVRARLPHGRALLYNEIAQAYLETIDFYRRIQTRTEPLADKKRWLSRIGFEMQKVRGTAQADSESGDDRVQEVFATGDEVRGWVAAAMSEEGRESSDQDAAEFVDYLARRSGLLLPRGQDQWAFLHLSFQEYFAACFLQNQIASPDWILDEDEIAPGARADDVRSYAGEAVWQETLVFLTELVAASDQPKWLKPIFKCLFGPDFNGIPVELDDAAGQSRALLLARLAIDPHAGLSGDNRQQAIDVCCDREVRLMRTAAESGWFNGKYLNAVLRVLLGAEPDERPAILQCLCRHAAEHETTWLDLTQTSVSDLSSLSGLSSLRRLHLNQTSVSDVSGLSGLSSLQVLELTQTSVSDVSGLSGLSSLQVLDLTQTSVSDVSGLSGLSSLQVLSLNQTSVSDLGGLSGLSGLSRLVRLHLYQTSVSDDALAAFHAARRRQGLSSVEVTR